MKYKLFVVLLVILTLIANSEAALAQEILPSAGAENPSSLRKSVVMPTGASNRSTGEIEKQISSVPTPAPTQVVNSDFENGPWAGWVEYSALGWPVVVSSADMPIPPRSGSWAAWLGGDDNEISYIEQVLTLQESTSLRLFYWIASENTCGLSDVGAVLIRESGAPPGYTRLHEWDLCSANDTDGWRVLDLDLSAFQGKTVEFRIGIITNGALNSNLFIDDVFLYTFADVHFTYWAQDFIHRLYNAGITGGCGTAPLTYCPEGMVTRGQMAVFLLRGRHGSTYTPPAVGSSTGFGDVPPAYWAAAWIKQLAAEGITGGCGSGNYCPEAPVTRAQMAVFLLRSRYGAAYTPPEVGSGTGFTDVPSTYWAAAWIKQLVAEGITSGCGAGTYCPESPVTRAQMAVFLVKTFNLP